MTWIWWVRPRLPVLARTGFMLAALLLAAAAALLVLPVRGHVGDHRVSCDVAAASFLPGDPGSPDNLQFFACQKAAGPYIAGAFGLGLAASLVAMGSRVAWGRQARS